MDPMEGSTRQSINEVSSPASKSNINEAESVPNAG